MSMPSNGRLWTVMQTLEKQAAQNDALFSNFASSRFGQLSISMTRTSFGRVCSVILFLRTFAAAFHMPFPTPPFPNDRRRQELPDKWTGKV